jgi:polysaccharide biosynthesis protein PslH
VRSHSTILFVTEKFPWPLDDGGQIRTYHVLKSLSSQFSVMLVSLAPALPEYAKPIHNLGVEVITFPRRRPTWLTPWFFTQALFTKHPYPLPKNFSFRILTELRRQVHAGKVQAVHFNHLDAAQYVDWLDRKDKSVRLVFDTHNLLTALYGRLVETERNLLRKMYCWLQWRKMHIYEQITMQKTDCVLVCSEPERQVLKEWGVKKYLVVPNGVDTQIFAPRPMLPKTEERPVHLVFTGAMDYLPNVDGVRWFLRSVLPELEHRLPHYKVTIVGKNPPAELRNWERRGRIEFTGRVEDVRQYTCLADVFVVPLWIGGGTRLKILEALAMQIPVVSTRIGAEGLDLCDGVHLRLADDASTMTQAIIDLCSQPDRAQEMARRGRKHVLERYDWKAVTYPLCDYYDLL